LEMAHFYQCQCSSRFPRAPVTGGCSGAPETCDGVVLVGLIWSGYAMTAIV
jgi:hypothetical protein